MQQENLLVPEYQTGLFSSPLPSTMGVAAPCFSLYFGCCTGLERWSAGPTGCSLLVCINIFVENLNSDSPGEILAMARNSVGWKKIFLSYVQICKCTICDLTNYGDDVLEGGVWI